MEKKRKLGFYWVNENGEWTIDEWCYDGWKSDNLDSAYDKIDEKEITR